MAHIKRSLILVDFSASLTDRFRRSLSFLSYSPRNSIEAAKSDIVSHGSTYVTRKHFDCCVFWVWLWYLIIL